MSVAFNWNQYDYVLNNPLANVGPLGNCSIKEGDTEATDDPGAPCVAGGDTSVSVNGGQMAPVEVILSDYNCPDDCIEVSTRDWHRVVASRKTQQNAPNNGTPQDPYKKRMFGTHWCGPGGEGPTVNGLDAACKAHDGCYDANGLTAGSNFNPLMGAAKTNALQQCNQALCSAAWKTSDAGNLRVITYFSQVPVGACHP